MKWLDKLLGKTQNQASEAQAPEVAQETPLAAAQAAPMPEMAAPPTAPALVIPEMAAVPPTSMPEMAAPAPAQNQSPTPAPPQPPPARQLAQLLATLAATPFAPQHTGFLQAPEQLKPVDTAAQLIAQLAARVPAVHKLEGFAQLHDAMQQAAAQYHTIKAEVDALAQRQEQVSGQIIRYTEMVQTFSRKFKLSADWEGKKPQMITLGQTLTEQREQCLRDEAALEQTLTQIYADFSRYHALFVQNYAALAAFLQTVE